MSIKIHDNKSGLLSSEGITTQFGMDGNKKLVFFFNKDDGLYDKARKLSMFIIYGKLLAERARMPWDDLIINDIYGILYNFGLASDKNDLKQKKFHSIKEIEDKLLSLMD